MATQKHDWIAAPLNCHPGKLPTIVIPAQAGIHETETQNKFFIDVT